MRRLRLLAACLVGLPVLAATPVAVHEITAPSPGAPAATAARFSLLQMNLCLSGLAPCLRYPQVVREAVAVIRTRRPSAVTLNEVCKGDVARIAEETGYHSRFTTVPYRGTPLLCTSPGGRGVFGNAVLTRAAVRGSASGRFTAEDPLEERRWLCVTTAQPVTVCATHLEAPVSLATIVIRHRQCAELSELLTERVRRGPTIAAGDINALGSCAPPGMWTLTDEGAAQKPGLQQVYGDDAHLRSPGAIVVRATSTDHDFLLVTARLVQPASP
jgi:endonuclease/exonuclease/phosphatase (EEP) superfamily protein YafD